MWCKIFMKPLLPGLMFIILALPALSVQDTASSRSPDIILIVSHGHGQTDLGCYGNTTIKTPYLDKLAAESVRFTHACGPTACFSASHAVIFTGLYNHATGQYGLSNSYSHFAVFPETRSLPSYLKNAGYCTARIGKLSVAPEVLFPFDTILGTGTDDRNTYRMAEQCLPFINVRQGKPFFLYFCLADPGRSYDEQDDHANGANRFGNNEQGYEGIIPTFYKPGKLSLPTYLPDTKETREEFAQYAQAVSRIDLGLGRLFEKLHEYGKWDNTLIIYLSDTGPSFPGSEGTLYQPGIMLPCIVKPPHVKPDNRICNAMINWTDITPTILDFSHALPAEYPVHGRSFKNAMMEEYPQGWDETFASHTFHEITMYYPMRMIMNRNYKLIWNIAWQLPFPVSYDLLNSATWQTVLKSGSGFFGKRSVNDYLQRPEFELYDLVNDPDEMNNQASNPYYSRILEDLKARLKNYQVKTNDPWIIYW
jgi:N-sulfoglucosamine sulfohydrolase